MRYMVSVIDDKDKKPEDGDKPNEPGTNQPITSETPASAQFPDLLGPQFPQLNWGFVVVIAATVFVWWLIERSSLGFRMRAVGENPFAARAAGVNVERIIFYAMAFAGALAGLAGVNQISGTITSGCRAAMSGPNVAIRWAW